MMEALTGNRPLFSFYGDDFTGSTDALEALASNGIATVLFLQPPDAAELSRFAACQAIGIAGESRSRSPAWMKAGLPPIFECLREIGAPIVQYKVCSTFDSSPEIGSIGCALDIGQRVFGCSYVPVVAAAPLMGRYVLFGNLFATGGDATYRIDRHPTMKHHPVTPMDESDLRLHLGMQTRGKLALMDIMALRSPDADARFDRLLQRHPDAVLFDGLDPATLERAAHLIWQRRHTPQTFVVGSSGFTYGMADFWRAEGRIAAAAVPSAPGCAERLLVLSGSCSPVTERQIRYARSHGFHGIRLHPAGLADGTTEEAVRELAAGRSVVLFSAQGPADHHPVADRRELGMRMGKLLREVAVRSGVRRVLVAGGDTSTHAVGELGITALTFLAPLTPGAPLCRAHSGQTDLPDLELVLKGGQVGPESFFEDVLYGRTGPEACPTQ